jgi:hypothetical protein
MVRAVRGMSGMVAGLLPLAEDAQRSVAAFEAKLLDAGGARFADP